MLRLWIEWIGVYVALPAVLLGMRASGYSFHVLSALWLAACPAAWYLVKCRGWGMRELFGFSLTRAQALQLAARLFVAAAVLSGGILWLYPEQFLELPRRDGFLWVLVLGCYPVFSVYPQGILYRGLFYARYACLFRRDFTCWLASALAFCFAHAVFANGWALGLTFIGGLLISRTYLKTGSLMAANLEHAVYGQLLFTCGWGRFLYQGTTRLLEQLSLGI